MAQKRKLLDADKAVKEAWQRVVSIYPQLPAFLFNPPTPQRYDRNRDVLGAIFDEIMDHPTDHGLGWLRDAKRAIKTHMGENDAQAAITAALYAVNRLELSVVALACAVHAQREATGKPVALREHKRRAGHRTNIINRRADAHNRMVDGLKEYDTIMDKEPMLKQSVVAKRCGVPARTLRGWLLTRETAAKQLGVSVRTLQEQWLKERKGGSGSTVANVRVG